MFGQIRNYIAQTFPNKVDQEHHGSRRLDCWWEPIYNPSLQGKLERGDWQFEDSAGPSKRYFTGPSLVAATSKGVLYNVKLVHFVSCDFQGSFNPETIVMFDGCRFMNCDFAYSYWRDTHFRNCHFEGCSFSLASFSRCQFRGNTWVQLGFSGSKTDLEKCHVTNPEEFIGAGFSGTLPGDNSFKQRIYQWYRLQGTKAHLARTLLASHEATGDDASFYETAKVHDLQQSFGRIAKHLNNLLYASEYGRIRAFFGVLFGISENLLLRFFGLINGWGASILKPLVSLITLFVLFSVFYKYGSEMAWLPALQKSFNITILVGYGNEYQETLSRNLKILQNVHAIISIIIYSVFFGTIISKLSRVR